MLVLSRKVGERLVVGDNITIVVNRIVGNRVTLGIEAPNNVRVMRAELRSFDETEQATGKEAAVRPSDSAPVPLSLELDVGALAAFMPRVAK